MGKMKEKIKGVIIHLMPVIIIIFLMGGLFWLLAMVPESISVSYHNEDIDLGPFEIRISEIEKTAKYDILRTSSGDEFYVEGDIRQYFKVGSNYTITLSPYSRALNRSWVRGVIITQGGEDQ
jgi:hypothetical protein